MLRKSASWVSVSISVAGSFAGVGLASGWWLTMAFWAGGPNLILQFGNTQVEPLHLFDRDQMYFAEQFDDFGLIAVHEVHYCGPRRGTWSDR